jgi:hypothetical protein
MHIYTVGCSFTYAQERGWPTLLTNKIARENSIEVKLLNHAHPGAGNTYIGNKPILDSYIRPQGKRPDLAVIMWSGLTRKDLAIDHEDKVLMDTLNGYGFVRWAGAQTSYVLSGGVKGSWEHHPTTREIFNPLYKFGNERTMAQDTLLSIIDLQNYFKTAEIPYLMSSYVNYWTKDAQVADIDFGIGQFADLRYLVRQIDFDRWVFLNERKDGIYELAKEIGDLQEDNFHPDFKTHALWADLIYKKLESENFFNN